MRAYPRKYVFLKKKREQNVFLSCSLSLSLYCRRFPFRFEQFDFASSILERSVRRKEVRLGKL